MATTERYLSDPQVTEVGPTTQELLTRQLAEVTCRGSHCCELERPTEANNVSSAEFGPCRPSKLPEFALTVTTIVRIAQLTLGPLRESQFRY